MRKDLVGPRSLWSGLMKVDWRLLLEMINFGRSFGVGGREKLANRIYDEWYKCDVSKYHTYTYSSYAPPNITT